MTPCRGYLKQRHEFEKALASVAATSFGGDWSNEESLEAAQR